MAYNILLPVSIASAVSMGASATSNVLEVKNQDNIGIQPRWTGTPTGTFDVQVSLDFAEDSFGNVTNAGTWTSLGLTITSNPGGSAGNGYIAINQLAAPYLRVVYTRVSGTGTLNIMASAKGI